MSFEIEGKLSVKYPVQEVSAKFKKQEFVIEVENERNPDWNDFVKFQLTQDRCGSVDAMEIGENIKVNFNIRGRKWEKDGQVNYFSNLEAWRVEKMQAAAGMSAPAAPAPSVNDVPAENDDLPF